MEQGCSLHPVLFFQRLVWAWALACAVSPTSSASRGSLSTRSRQGLWRTWMAGYGMSALLLLSLGPAGDWVGVRPVE